MNLEIEQYIEYLRNKWDINFNIDKENLNIEIVIRITKICNENCIFCGTDLDNSFIEYTKVLEIIDFCNIKYKDFNLIFSLSWWEPTIYPRLYDVIKYIFVKSNNYVMIQTNAVIFSDLDFLKKFKEFEWKIYFNISFHSNLPKIYNYITSSNSFYRAFKWILNIYKNFNSKYILLNFVVNRFNYLSFNDYLLFLDKYFWVYWNVKLTFSIMLPNKPRHKQILLNYDKIVKILNEAHELILINKFNVSIDYGAWGYVQLPYCFFIKLDFIKNIEEYIAPIDFEVWENLMNKLDNCKNCLYNLKCIWIPNEYISLYWHDWIKPIIK